MNSEWNFIFCQSLAKLLNFFVSFFYKKRYAVIEDGKIIANPGSVSLPKGGTENSYMILNDNEIVLKDMRGSTIKKLNF